MTDAPKVKPAGSLSNGIYIGLGSAMLTLGLLMAFSLNAVYNEQATYLAANGIQVHSYSYGFNDLIFLISIGVLVAVLGACLLVEGCLSHYSERARVALSDNGNWGNRLINGGVTGLSLFSAGLVRDLYQSTQSDWYVPVITTLFAVCLILIITGALLLIRIPYRNQQPTKVQDVSTS
jgi:hypothetical protein